MYKYILIIFIFLNIQLHAEIVQNIEIKGNDRISKETIKVYGEIDLNKDYTKFDIDKILKNLYSTDFFEDVKISLSNKVLTISVKEYPVINSISLDGEKSKSVQEKVLKTLFLKSKGSFIKNKLTEDISQIKKLYASIGFNFMTVEAKVKNFGENRINLIYFIDKGKKTDIKKINFIGDKKIKEKRLRDIIASEESKFWKFLSKNTFLSLQNIELDKRLLVNYYKSLGYYDVQVLSNNAEISEDNSTILTYSINAGNRFIVNKISTNVSQVLDKKLFLDLNKKFVKVVGQYYSPFTVKKLLDELDILIASKDLQFIEHSVNEILEENTIEIKINIFEGEKLLVEKINILGNTVTDESVIRGELLLDEGDPFNDLKLDQSVARIKAKNIFGVVKTNVTNGSNKALKLIDVTVEEKPTGEISAGAGLGTNGGSFAFSVTENNWLGKGIGVSTNIDISAETFSGGITVNNPNYNYSGNSLNYHITTTKNDKPNSGFKNDIFSTGLGTSFEQYNNVYIAPSLSLSHDDLKVEASASDSLKKQKGTFTDLNFNYGLTLDKRNRVYATTEGYTTSFNQTLPIYADSPYIKNSFQLSKYKAFSENYIGKFKFYSAAVNGLNDKDIRISKRINLSTKRLRGFKGGSVGPKDGNDFVGGNYAMATNFEIALPNFLPESTKTDVGLFLDFGNLWKVDYSDSVDDSNKIRSTIGANTSWLSPLGPMTFVFSKNISKAATDLVETFSFRLGTTF